MGVAKCDLDPLHVWVPFNKKRQYVLIMERSKKIKILPFFIEGVGGGDINPKDYILKSVLTVKKALKWVYLTHGKFILGSWRFKLS